ncbi:hypothetical protein [Longimicrobium sp.]|uniref:hypothetical protein n=1 Tax=Longimicrobium sp. TaxID=2029185 RepID=UPI002C27DBF1|nr:hypothetical protein [Longimicrobium sp.]HSU12555.1 hypothetical protein [Longimicrobium sp.]
MNNLYLLVTWPRVICREFKVRTDSILAGEQLVNDAIGARLAAIDAQLRRDLSELNSDNAFTRTQLHNDQVQVQEELPQVFRSALFMQIYALFEKMLGMFSNHFEETIPTGIKEKDLQGSGIVRSQKFLKAVCGLPFPDQNPAWGTMRMLGKLRNAYAHRRGMLGPEPEHQVVRQFAKSHSQLIAIHGDEVSLKSGFLPYVVAEMREVGERFVAELHKSLIDV